MTSDHDPSGEINGNTPDSPEAAAGSWSGQRYYELLQVPQTATPDEIKAAYLRERERLAVQETDPAGASALLQELDEAYAVLVDSNRRLAYDRTLSADQESTELVVATPPILPVAPPMPPVPQQNCPHCGKPNPIQATICAFCHQQISRSCPQCGQPVLVNATVCPRCGTYVPEYDLRRFAEAKVTEQRVKQEREKSESRVATLEAGHRANLKLGVVFWTVVFLLCVGLAALAFFLHSYLLPSG